MAGIKIDPPVPNALIVLVDPGSKKIVAYGFTDENGYAKIEVPAGTYDLYICKEDFLVYKTTITIPETLSVQAKIKSGIFIGYGLPFDIGLSVRDKPKISVEATLETTDVLLNPTTNLSISLEYEVT